MEDGEISVQRASIAGSDLSSIRVEAKPKKRLRSALLGRTQKLHEVDERMDGAPSLANSSCDE